MKLLFPLLMSFLPVASVAQSEIAAAAAECGIAQDLMDHDYLPVGPLLPLGGLIGGGPVQ